MKWFVLCACLLGFLTGFAEMNSLPVGKECQVGTTWRSACYDCRCSGEGLAVCTKKPCEEKDAAQPGNCAPETKWKNDCNSCFCTSNGLAACTERGCLLINPVQVETKVLPVGKECQVGTTWRSACYACSCSGEGLAVCTKKPCVEKDAAQPGNCAPETKWQNDCNSCFCTSNGLSACTKRGCLLINPVQQVKTKEYAECLAGTSWESNCHWCDCSADGKAQCTELSCGDKTVLDEPLRCKPNTTFARDCNTCLCLNNGNVLCSLRGCDERKPAETVVAPGPSLTTTTSTPEVTLSGRECAVGTTWKSKCNQCYCSPSGYPTCTLLGCPSETGSELRCQPESRWKDDCNNCFCTANGIALCTRAGCGDPYHKVPELNFGNGDKEVASNEMHPLQMIGVKKRSTCTPGEMAEVDCNTCRCNDDGTGYDVCTKRACVKQPPQDVAALQRQRLKRENGPCVKGETFKIDCNTCQCNEYGTNYWCTKLGCLHNETPGQNVAVQVYNDRFKREVCKPNESFQQECNTCKCDADGATLKCTQNECMDKENGDVEVFMENEGTDHIERHSVCQPNTKFEINCNTCECNYDGTDYRCTDQVCPLPDDVELFKELQDETHIVPFKMCEPKGVFNDGCNKCYCNEDGTDYRCTKTTCKGSQTKKSKQDVEAKSVSTAYKNIVCQANKAFQKDCNTCWCNEDGTGYFCTRKVCIPNLPDDVEATEEAEELRIIQKECRPDEVFELDCNMCRCNPDGKSFSCTRRACVTDAPPDGVDYEPKNSLEITAAPEGLRPKRHAATTQSIKACQPGERFRLDCNTCLCHTDGKDFACTRNNCHETVPEDKTRRRREVGKQDKQYCEPGSVFSEACNMCRCLSDGRHATCTLKKCPSIVPKPREHGKEDTDLGFRCTPGEQFKRNCNDCTCSADGKSVFCTIKLCENDITPQL